MLVRTFGALDTFWGSRVFTQVIVLARTFGGSCGGFDFCAAVNRGQLPCEQ